MPLDCIGCAAPAILSYKYQAIGGKQWLDYASTFTLGGKKKKKKKKTFFRYREEAEQNTLTKREQMHTCSHTQKIYK